eukprot:356357-Chlamydomonas_euryale.AAC.3
MARRSGRAGPVLPRCSSAPEDRSTRSWRVDGRARRGRGAAVHAQVWARTQRRTKLTHRPKQNTISSRARHRGDP